MVKKGTFWAIAWCLSAVPLLAQQKEASIMQNQGQDNSDFTFTESQLDEDGDAAQTVSTIVTSNNDPYLSEVGYLFSPMRFRVRGYDNMYSQSYLNGLLVNDLELGRFSYSMIGGLNDATRNKEGVSGFESNMFGVTGIGGGENTNLRASQFATGNKITLSGCNRNYKVRGMYTFATGLLNNGWAFAGSVGYRWADEGVIEGTFYNSFSYLLAAEKRINDEHSISLVSFGAPTERAQQGASTEEVYWLANNHYYNPNWGYQDGKKRNARVVNDYQPTAILTWDWTIDAATKLATSFGFKHSMYSSTALSWGGDAYDPRPDYYKNLPSAVFDVHDPLKNNPEYLEDNPYLLSQYNDLVEYWTSSKANRQVNWDQMYFVNRQNEANGGETLYYQERRHNDQQVWSFSSAFNKTFNKTHRMGAGMYLNATKGMHYKTMADLLGGTLFTDIDKFAANDYGRYSDMAQNDLNNPNRQIKKDDKFGYNYNIYVNKARLWGQYQYSEGPVKLNVAAHMEGTTMEREGLMRNGRAKDNSYGKSGVATFFGGGVKTRLVWNPIANHHFSLAAGYESVAPLARNSFVAPRMQNNFVDNLTLEDIVSSEASWFFRWGDVSGKVAAYYTKFMNQVEQTAFYNDQEERFTYLTMNSIDKQHYGVEFAVKYQLTSELSFNVLGTISEAQYINNPYAQVNYEGMDAKTIETLNKWKNPMTNKEMPLQVIADGMRVNGTPLTALSFGVNYNVNGWFFETNLNYYDRGYIGFSAYRRLSNVIENYAATGVDVDGNLVYSVTKDELDENGGVLFDKDGKIVKAYSARQEKFDGGFMLDASIGRYIRLKRGRTMSINLSAQNLTNNTDMRTGGYEQNRDDYYNTGVARSYKFSKNSKYYYANALNVFLNVNYRF